MILSGRVDELEIYPCKITAISTRCLAGFKRVASGQPAQVIAKAKAVADHEQVPLIFPTMPLAKLLRQAPLGHAGCAFSKAAPPPKKSSQSRGRPKLGVVGREVTLLPRHWEWLNSQPGGASVALRKLVDEARRVNGNKDRVRSAQEASYRFMVAIAGDLPGFEEATRALFQANEARFDEMVEGWPADVKNHARKLAAAAFAHKP